MPKITRQQSGSALLESLICIPVILFLLLGSLAVNNSINKNIKLNSITRIFAVAIVNDCYGKIAKNMSEAEFCVKTSLHNSIGEAKTLESNLAVIATVYNDDSDASQEFQVKMSTENSGLSTEISQFDSNIIKREYFNLLNATGFIIAIDVITPKAEPVIPFINFISAPSSMGLVY